MVFYFLENVSIKNEVSGFFFNKILCITRSINEAALDAIRYLEKWSKNMGLERMENLFCLGNFSQAFGCPEGPAAGQQS